MNFTLEIKKEILDKKMNKDESFAFINGFLFSHQVDKKQITLKIMNQKIYEKIIYLLEKFHFHFQLDKNILIINNQVKEIKPKYANIYLAGIFVASGSVSNLNSSSYHLEISFKKEENCKNILEFSKKHILFNQIKNKNNYVLYLKKNEVISDFLQIIGAQKSYFNFIDSIIERDFKNQITRIFNLDVHNQNRLVDSNILFKENYQYILDHNLTSLFTKAQLDFFEFKKNNEFLSLSQLSEKLWKQKKIKITKSGLNHWLIKLKNVKEHHENSN